MAHRVDEKRAALRVVEQVILQVRIALDDPDVAEDLEEHSRRTPRAPLAAQLIEDLPQRRSEQSRHDLAIGKRRVVVGNLAQPRDGSVGIGSRSEAVGKRVHGAIESLA
jgi:hypothetical protein